MNYRSSELKITLVQDLGPAWRGGQFCIVSLEADAAPYMRILFFLLFLAPVSACLGLMIRVWFGLQELSSRLAGLGVSDHSLQPDSGDLGLEHASNRFGPRFTNIKCHELQIEFSEKIYKFDIHFIHISGIKGLMLGDGLGWRGSANTLTIYSHLPIFIFTFSNWKYYLRQSITDRSSYTDSLKSNNEEELVVTGRKKKLSLPLNNIDINKEKRTQKFLLLILISHFICILPINIVK